MPDRLFALPELAQLYDPLDRDRSDLDAYVEILENLGAQSVLDALVAAARVWHGDDAPNDDMTFVAVRVS